MTDLQCCVNRRVKLNKEDGCVGGDVSCDDRVVESACARVRAFVRTSSYGAGIRFCDEVKRKLENRAGVMSRIGCA